MSTSTSYPIVACLLLLVAGSSKAGHVLLYPYGHCLNSHLLNGEKLANLLLEHGHKVSMLISDSYQDFEHLQDSKEANSSLTMLQFPAPANYTPICDYDTVDFMMYSPMQDRFDAFIDTAVRYCDAMLGNTALMRSLKRYDFDVFIVEALDPCGKILADYLDIPFIPLMTAGLGHWDGNIRLPSHLPAAIAPFTNRMTFLQRIGNLIMKTLYATIPIFMGFDNHFEELKEKYNLNVSLSISSTFNRAAVKLINSDFSIEYPAPVEPDSIMVGGFAVGEPKDLTSDLEAYMQSAGEHGVIIMSTGTLVKRFDERWTNIFAQTFARLPQKVIWRYYDSVNKTTMLAYPFGDNIKLMKWIPQLDLLAHPQTRLFITHCGLNALFEAVHTGVPVVAIPMSGDQMNNAAKLTSHAGMGLKVDMFSLDSETLFQAIQAVLHNPIFAANARAMATLIQDQPMTPRDKINYWVDYVIRHKGAEHLHSSGRNMSWWQYYSLDVIATIVTVIVMLFVVLSSLLVCAFYSLWKYLSFSKTKVE